MGFPPKKSCFFVFRQARRSDALVHAWIKVAFVKENKCVSVVSVLPYVCLCCRPASDAVLLRPSITVFAAGDWRLLEKGQASASNAISTFKQLLTVQTKALVQRHTDERRGAEVVSYVW